MSFDYQVIAFRDAAKLTKIGLLFDPSMALDVYGRDFREISKVLVNGVPSDEFIVLSLDHLVAQVPRSQIGAELLNVTVLSARELNTPISVISFEATIGNRPAEGRVRLVQNFLALLFQTPGSNIFDRNQGGGLYRLAGTTSSPGEVRSEATLCIERARNQLIQAQAGDGRLALSERLQSVTLLGVDFSPQASTIGLRLRLTAADGSTSEPSVTV